MAFAFLWLLSVSLIFNVGNAAAAPPGNTHPGIVGGHIPILYEAYYPEPRKWSPQASLQEIEKLREMTSQLLKEEEQLGKLAAADGTPEDVFQPRSQLLEYVFSAAPAPSDVGIASLTVSDAGPRRTRHHHGQADWLLRRLAADSAR